MIWVQIRAFRRLPERHGRRPDGDWLDDLSLLLRTIAGRRPVNRLDRRDPVGFLRDHIIAFALGLSFVTGLLIMTALAIGEHGLVPGIYFIGLATFTSGMFGFCLVCNSALVITVPRAERTSRSTGRARRAGHVAVIAGTLAVPAALGLRDSIWEALGHDTAMGAIWELAVVIIACGVLTGLIAFTATFVFTRVDRERTN